MTMQCQAGDMHCAADHLLIPGGRDTMEAALVSHSHDRYCGGALNPENNAEEGASVFSKIQVSTLLPLSSRGLNFAPELDTE